MVFVNLKGAGTAIIKISAFSGLQLARSYRRTSLATALSKSGSDMYLPSFMVDTTELLLFVT